MQRSWITVEAVVAEHQRRPSPSFRTPGWGGRPHPNRTAKTMGPPAQPLTAPHAPHCSEWKSPPQPPHTPLLVDFARRWIDRNCESWRNGLRNT